MNFFEKKFPWYFGFLFFVFSFSLYFFSTDAAKQAEHHDFASQSEDLSCNCSLRNGTTFSSLTFETPEECGADRNYLNDGIKALKELDKGGYYGKTRDLNKTSQVIPRKCFLYSMKHTLPPEMGRPSFAVCDPNTIPKKGASDFVKIVYKACVNEDLVNLVYNSYLDVVDCFDVPPRFAVAKFMNESGMALNIVASNNDAGLSQFSNGAMGSLKRFYPQWSKRILNSKKASCQRLLSVPGAMPMSADEVNDSTIEKCHIVGVPPNPLRNLIYYGAYYHMTRDDVDSDFNRSVRYLRSAEGAISLDENYVPTADILKQARAEKLSMENVRMSLSVMAYNTGPKAVTYFREWMKYRNAKFPNVPVIQDDMDLTITNPWVIDDSKDTDEEVKTKFGIDDKKPLKFWEWMVLNTKSRFRYASYVKYYANRLDRTFGAGVCTEKNFLE